MTFLTTCTISTCFFVGGRQLSLLDKYWISVVEGGGMIEEGEAGELGVKLVGLANKGNGQVMFLPSIQRGRFCFMGTTATLRSNLLAQ